MAGRDAGTGAQSEHRNHPQKDTQPPNAVASQNDVNAVRRHLYALFGRRLHWALLASIVATCKLSDVNPVAYIAATLEAILNGYPQSRIEDLMPWHFRKTSSPNA
jgi:hypothetical protein